LIGLAVILLRPARDKSKEAPAASAAGPITRLPRKDWKSWLPYVGIALLLAIWSIWGALFFLTVVWLIRQNPGAGTDFTVSENEKKTARRVYTWLFLSPLLTVPVFIGALFSAYDSSTDGHVLAALIPLILHVPLLAGLTSKNGFVYRHTQQAILLMALRAGTASLAATMIDSAGILLFLLGNGGLWLLGSLLGWDQVRRGECWLMRRKGETVEIITGGPGSAGNFAPAVHLQKSREFMQRFKKEDAMAHALAAFRKGNRDVRLQALRVLEVLEEVEKF
jgi:vacuolar-type H+-ATPase subunit I/STV1